MANIMSMKTINNRPSRNGFDLSSKRNFTAKAGELLPVWWQEVIPGDVFDIDLSAFARTMPLNTSAFARVKQYYDFYFVPWSHLWNRANAVLSQMDFNQQHATGLASSVVSYSGEMPYFTTSQVVQCLQALNNITGSSAYLKNNFFGYSRAQLACKVLEYLGYGDFSPVIAAEPKYPSLNLDLNAGPLLAYQKIYSDYFRDQQWERPNPSAFNVDYMTGEDSMNMALPTENTSPFYVDDYNMFDMRYCNWQKDLYHGLLPSPQYGETAVVPLSFGSISSSIPQDTYFNLSPRPSTGGPTLTGNLTQAGVGTFKLDGASIVSEKLEGSSLLAQNVSYQGYNSFGDIPVNVSLSSSGLSILALRQYEFLQKWREIAQSGDQDYKAITKRIWGVDVSDHLSDKCTYLGGIDSSLDINEVVNTNITGEYQAEIAGKGVGVSNGHIRFGEAKEFGFIMCVYHALPVVDYTVSYINPSITRINAEDYANPVFDRVGMQAVPFANLYNPVTAPTQSYDMQTFNLGYAPRFVDYKTSIDLSMGAFRTSLSHWVVSYDEDSISDSMLTGVFGPNNTELPSPNDEQPSGAELLMSYRFFKMNPNVLDSIFATAVDSTVDTDQFLCSSFFDVKAVRNLDVDGLPY